MYEIYRYEHPTSGKGPYNDADNAVTFIDKLSSRHGGKSMRKGWCYDGLS